MSSWTIPPEQYHDKPRFVKINTIYDKWLIECRLYSIYCHEYFCENVDLLIDPINNTIELIRYIDGHEQKKFIVLPDRIKLPTTQDGHNDTPYNRRILSKRIRKFLGWN